MQDADLFLELAGIAGVFIGFGALIAVRNGGPTEPLEVAPMRSVVLLGMLTVVAALAPVTLGRYGLAEHQVWAPSSALVLVGWLVGIAASARTPEYRAGWAAELEADRSGARGRWLVVVEGAFFLLYLLAALLTPFIILLGVAPDREAALYFTVVVLILLGAAWTLLELVFAKRRPPVSEVTEATSASAGGSIS